MKGGRMLVQALGLLGGSTFVFLVGTTHDVQVLLVSMAIFGFCKGFYDSNIFASIYDVVHPRKFEPRPPESWNTVGWGGAPWDPWP